MANKKNRQKTMRAPKELRAFYESMNLSEETIERAIKSDLNEVPEEALRSSPNKTDDKKSN